MHFEHGEAYLTTTEQRHLGVEGPLLVEIGTVIELDARAQEVKKELSTYICETLDTGGELQHDTIASYEVQHRVIKALQRTLDTELTVRVFMEGLGPSTI